jgi:hypothetical protein
MYLKRKFKKIVAAVRKAGTLNLVLMIVGAFFVWFNWQMIQTFRMYGRSSTTFRKFQIHLFSI